MAEQVFAVNMNQLWKECNPKDDTFLTEFMKQSTPLTTEGQILCLLKWVMNLLDGSLFNSSLIFRNLKNRIWYVSYCRLGATGGLPCTEYMFCRKGMTTRTHGLLLPLLLRQAGPGRALSQSLVVLQVMHLSWAQETSVRNQTQDSHASSAPRAGELGVLLHHLQAGIYSFIFVDAPNWLETM